MAWKAAADRPIYAQLVEKIQVQLVSGGYPPGGSLPGVREMAAREAVNPNTVQRAYGELEKSGLAVPRGTGIWTVTGDTERIARAREALAQGYVNAFLAGMEELGYTKQEAAALAAAAGRDEP